MGKYIMALDQGTTSSRCILFDKAGKMCSVARKEFAQYYPKPGEKGVIMGKYIMALDQGTTSSRCILFDKAGKMCSVARKEFAQYYPKPGWVEHDPHEIWSSQMGVAIEAMSLIGGWSMTLMKSGHPRWELPLKQ